jgi:hypothetical protein
VKYASSGWAFDSLFRSNTALPVNITTGQFGAFGMEWNDDAINQRPNVVQSEPLYRYGGACTGANGGLPCPSGKGFNPARFSTPSIDVQGNLQRNVLRGFGAWQEDIALRRTFPIHDSLSLQFRAEAFNIFNHPLFGDPGTNDNDRNELTNQNFGISAHTLADSLGGGGADGGFSSLYQIGSPRSMQFALKVQF